MKQAIGILCCLLFFGVASFAQEKTETKKSGGWWRVETSAGPIIYTEDSKISEYCVLTSIEYEIPVASKTTLSVNLIPLGDFDDGIYLCGAGTNLRIYGLAEVYRGWFWELGFAPVYSTPRFQHNSSDLNFYSHTGAGYEFMCRWHLALEFGHISNADLGEENLGVNLMVLAAGRRF